MHFEDGDSIITYPICSRFWITNKYEPFLNNEEMIKQHSEELEEYIKKNPNTIILLNSGENFVKTYPTLVKGIVMISEDIIYRNCRIRVHTEPKKPNDPDLNISIQNSYTKLLENSDFDFLEKHTSFETIEKPGLYMATACSGKSTFIKKKKVEELIKLYNTVGNENYFGEVVSKKEHMIQAAVSAEEHIESEQLILACLLHDIGHLLEKDNMNGLGVMNHCTVGKQYLEKMGMNKKVCKLVEGHIAAKRYLVSIDESYYEKLSDASKKTLKYQGGKMNEEEINNFEKDLDMIEILGVRYHDDNGKKIKIKNLPTIESFIPLIQKYMC